MVTPIWKLSRNGTFIVATLPEQHRSMLGIFSICPTFTAGLYFKLKYIWMKLVIIDVSIQSSHGYCSRHWSTERLVWFFQERTSPQYMFKQRHESHSYKYHLATEHQELEYKKQLEWASYTQPKQFSCEVSQIHKLAEYSLSHMITHCPSHKLRAMLCPLCWWGIRQL